MKEPERSALLRITGKFGGSVVVELNDSYAPGIPDEKGQLLVHNDFVAGVLDTYVDPSDLATRCSRDRRCLRSRGAGHR
ncbi:DUF5959 family protein [Streptomyces sp. NPDC002596]